MKKLFGLIFARALVTALAVFFVPGCGSKDKGAVPPAPEGKAAGGAVARPLSPDDEAKLKQAVAEGDALYDAGLKSVSDSKKPPYKVPDRKKFDDAFEKYMIVVNAPQPLPDKGVMGRVYGRVIDVAASRKNNKALAKEVAMKSLRQEILPVCNSPESAPVLAAARKELKAEDKELDDWLEKEDKKGGSTKGGQDREELVEKIHKGMSRQAVISILGQPDLSMPLGQGQAMLYYLSDTEAFFISIDKNGNVFTADRQERSK
ncbi:MAG: outer membrane protein assembly factor BamE [Gemmataceae bacterium]|nr:outer membrane protein assembly factor BamE [Gemmataceae bacterium]